MTSGFDEHDLVRALNAPPTAAELADEATYRAMFRAEGPARLANVTLLRPGAGRTAVRRVGTASTLAAVFALAGAGVAAAAYSSHLPAPVQGAVHRVLGPIGVPAADPPPATQRAEADQVAPPQPEAPAAPASTDASPQPSAQPTDERSPSTDPTSEATATLDPTTEPEVTPTAPVLPLPTDSVTPSAGESPAASESPTPTTSPSATPSETPTETMSPSATPTTSTSPSPTTSPPSPSSAPATPVPTPAAVSLSAAVGHQVAPGQATVFSGLVSGPDGSAVPDARVVLQERTDAGWRPVGEGTTAADGSVTLSSQPAARTARYRLKVDDVRSAPWRLVLKPTVSASASTSGSSSRVDVTVSGGRAGSPVLLVTWKDGKQVVVTSSSLGSNGRVRFEVPAPATQSSYAVRIVPTGTHGGASTRVLVDAGAPAVTP